LALLNVRAGKAPDDLYFCYDCVDFHFTHTGCAPSCTCLCCILLSAAFIMCACISRLQKGISARLRMLVDPFIVN
jgi:hypothetical protein